MVVRARTLAAVTLLNEFLEWMADEGLTISDENGSEKEAAELLAGFRDHYRYSRAKALESFLRSVNGSSLDGQERLTP